MTDTVKTIVGIISLNGGRLVGKTRLQKVAYLLEACGMHGGFDFDYHHYGPYSEDVAEAADIAELVGLVTSEEKRGFHSVPYVIYQTSEPRPILVGSMSASDAAAKLEIMESYSALVLELAATICYLEREEAFSPDGARKEVVVRKAVKASPERLKQADELLEKLDLQ